MCVCVETYLVFMWSIDPSVIRAHPAALLDDLIGRVKALLPLVSY